jgi:hypothetical protein
MDPNATWKRFLDACDSADFHEAQDALEDLCEWLTKGGFPPDGIPRNAIYYLRELSQDAQQFDPEA